MLDILDTIRCKKLIVGRDICVCAGVEGGGGCGGVQHHIVTFNLGSAKLY